MTGTQSRLFKDAALLLVGHGAAAAPEAQAPTLRQAERLSRLGLFAEVRAAFLKGAAPLEEALGGVAARTVFVVPNLMSNGHFARRVIPRRLGLNGPVTRRDGRLVVYCAPPGTDPALAGIVRERVAELCRENGLDLATASVLLVGHGSEKERAAGEAVRAHGEGLAKEGGFAAVRTAFLDEAPRLADLLAEDVKPPVVVVGMFAADGLHSERDLRDVLARTGGFGTRIFYTGAIGAEPAFCGLILAAVKTAARSVAPTEAV